MFVLPGGQSPYIRLILLCAVLAALAADAPTASPAAKEAQTLAADKASEPAEKASSRGATAAKPANPEPAVPTAAESDPVGPASASTDSAAEGGPLDGRGGRDLALDQFRPRSMLRVAEHHLQRARFPVVDVHFHPRVRFHENRQMLDDFVKVMDRQNIAVCVSLDGQMGDSFLEHRHYLWDKYRDRFVIFANVDWRGDGQVDEPATWDCQRPTSGGAWPSSWPRPKPPVPAG